MERFRWREAVPSAKPAKPSHVSHSYRPACAEWPFHASAVAPKLLVALAITLPLLLGSTSPASAAGFCETKVVRDYAKPLEQMPRLRAVPADRRLPFGPHGVYLFPRSNVQILLPKSRERVGYTLRIVKSGKLSNPDLPPLKWLVTAKLVRVDPHGRLRELLKWRRRRIIGPGDNGDFGFGAPKRLGNYRVEIAFRSGIGRLLGRFGEYFRVLAPIADPRLTLNAASYSPGESVLACFENYGTTTLGYDNCGISIQSYNGSAWEQAAIYTPRACADVGLELGPGEASYVGNFIIPADAPPGSYRAVLARAFTAEFQIVTPNA